MENLKIKVNSEAESKEVQDFAKSDGYSRKYNSFTLHKGWVCLNSEKYILCVCHSQAGNELDDYKEITLPELRDLVVLKRNSIDDATHIDKIGEPWLVFGNNEFYSWADNGWMQESENVVLNYNPKPIEKKEMKEYLRKNSNGTYSYIGTVRPEHVSDFMVEIPEGAESFNYFGNEGNVFFLKNNSEITLYSNETEDWAWQDWGDIDFDGVVCLWSRHTHPEELPFIDDEPKIETATGYQLDVVGSNTYGSRSRYDGESDISYRQYLMNFIVGNRTESINDQYAEIEKVRQTLNQRQEQYGSFEDVAMITEQMVDVMRKGYYENLAYNQKMALYMICSKMARIVNGNPNHKDSWHDIAGYATLIDNELVSEKDMPF